MSMPRLLLPRQDLLLRDPRLRRLLLSPAQRYASTLPPPKPRVLEKPARYNPPSHAARRTKPRQYPGAPLSEHERASQKTRRYPHMMPLDGTFMHWFLSSRLVHLCITLTILASCSVVALLQSFLQTTPYKDLLPPDALFREHPVQYVRRWMEVYGMHVTWRSQQSAAKRKAYLEEVRKRSEYRNAHGTHRDEGIFGVWTPRTDEEVMGQAAKEGGTPAVNAVDVAPSPRVAAVYADFDGKTQPAKSWLGIW